MSIDVAIPGDIKVIKKEAEKILKYNRNSMFVECESKNNRCHWNHFKITQTIAEQHTRKGQNQRTTKKHPYWALNTY